MREIVDRPCYFLVPLGFEGRHRCLVVTFPILFVERGRGHNRTWDGTRLNAGRRSFVPRPAFAGKYREWDEKQRERGGEDGEWDACFYILPSQNSLDYHEIRCCYASLKINLQLAPHSTPRESSPVSLNLVSFIPFAFPSRAIVQSHFPLAPPAAPCRAYKAHILMRIFDLKFPQEHILLLCCPCRCRV